MPAAGWADGQAAWRAMRALGVVDLMFGPARADGATFVADLTYRLVDHDQVPSLVASRWRPTGGGLLPVGSPQLPWDEPGATAFAVGLAAVVGAAGEQICRAAGADAAAGAADVESLLSGPPIRPVVWLPDDIGLFRRAAVGPVDVQSVPAVTVGEVREGRSLGADRIVVNPGLWRRLLPEGRRVVLRHEVTHLALRRDHESPRPLALEEGLCDYVAYRGSPLAAPRVAAPLLDEVRRSGLPGHLPRSSDFQGAGRSAAYAASWLLCAVLAEQAGEAPLVAWVRAAHGVEIDDPDLLGPLRAITGWDASRLFEAWGARVASMAVV